MHCPEEALATEVCSRACSSPLPLVGSLYGFCCAIIRRAVPHPRGRSLSKLVACPPPPLPEIHNPFLLDDDLPYQYHSSLAQGLRLSLSSICDWLAKDDVQVAGKRPISAGGFADVWRGSLDNRQVAIKSYRCYLSSDSSLVCLVGLPSLACSCH